MSGHMQQSTIDCDSTDAFPFQVVFDMNGFVRVDSAKSVTIMATSDVMNELIKRVSANAPSDDADAPEVSADEDE